MMMKMKIAKTTKVAIIAILVLLIFDWYYLTHWKTQHFAEASDLKIYRKSELRQYDGTDVELPVLLALDGYVYDVSSGRDDFYGPGEAYHYLAGKDASIPLQLFGKEIVKSKYQVVGIFKP